MGYKDLDGTSKTDALFLACDLEDACDNPNNTFTRGWVEYSAWDHGLNSSVDAICKELVALGFKEIPGKPAPTHQGYLGSDIGGGPQFAIVMDTRRMK